MRLAEINIFGSVLERFKSKSIKMIHDKMLYRRIPPGYVGPFLELRLEAPL